MPGAGAREGNSNESKRQRTEDDGVGALANAAEIFKMLTSKTKIRISPDISLQNHVEAFRMAEVAAESCVHCLGILGWCYLHRRGVGVIYEGGWGGTEDELVEKRQREKYCEERGFELGTESAAAGSMYGQLVVGDAYYYGMGGRVDNEVEASKHYKLAADLGLAEAQFELGCFYNAAQQITSHSELLEVYRVSGRVEDLEVETLRYLNLAAEQGHPDAQMLLASMHSQGLSGLQQDHNEAVRFYQLAAADGKRPLAFEKLGLSYMSGQGVAQDEEEAVRFFMRAIEEGGVETSYIHLARAYELGTGVPQDYAEARRLYARVKNISPWSEQWPFSMCAHRFQAYRNLAELNLVGKGGPHDIPRAIQLLEHASQHRDAVSACILGSMYLKGFAHVNPNFEQAARHFKRALVRSSRFPLESDNETHPTCMFASIHACRALAQMYENGQGVEQSLLSAAEFYSRHCDHDRESAYHAARLEEISPNLKLDSKEVIDLYRFAASDRDALRLPQSELPPQCRLLLDESKWSSAEAQCYLACLLRDGDRLGVTRNVEEAFDLFQKAADQGHLEAICHLARMHEIVRWTAQGVITGDIATAVQLLRTAADKGHADAQYRLARHLEDGFPKPSDVDLKERARLLELAAKQGHAAALLKLACMHADGNGVVKCNLSASRYLSLAIAHGSNLSPKRQCRLAVMFETGKIVEKDEAMAAHWYSLAALKKFAPAQQALACMYYDGRGVSKDRKEALRFFTLAAHQELADSQYRLACMLDIGVDCALNAAEAERWFKKAEDHGHEKAEATMEAKFLNSNFLAHGETTDLW